MNVDKNFQLNNNINGDFSFYNPLDTKEITIYGFPFLYIENSFKRIPTCFYENIPINIQTLSRNTSGGQLHFYTNSNKLVLDCKLTNQSAL